MHRLCAGFGALLGLGWVAIVGSAPGNTGQAPAAAEIALREGLVIRPVGRYGRSPIHTDAIQAQIVAGKWAAPKAGATVALRDGSTQTWVAAAAGEDGWISHPALAGGYAYLPVTSDHAQVMILEASGHSMVYVNGEPRAGDPYQTGYVRLPVSLRSGINDLLFHVGRGRMRAKLVAPKAVATLDPSDSTLPDLLVGEAVDTWGALLVINAAEEPVEGTVIRSSWPHGDPIRTRVPAIAPLSARKVGFRLKGPAPAREGTVSVDLQLLRREGGRWRALDGTTLDLRARSPRENHKRTFRSEIDGSVQYYAVNLARQNGSGVPSPALFLSLHGAGVEAIGQADAYAGKSWGHLVAPTNRRPFGFDWEDWGRLDALEVLDLARRALRTDPRRTYLTGHSMGGHGVWHLGVTFPDRFAAIGPSAGWISFWSYAGAPRFENQSLVEELLLRASGPSDTLALVRNTAQYGVYILHGGTDDNVPADQARTMNQQLGAFHRDFVYHEQPGAGHWWDASDEPGTDCVDWAPMFDFFARRAIPAPESVRQVRFTTANPGVSAWSRWAGIEAQVRPLSPSSIDLRCDPGQRRFVGTTDNVARLALDVGHLGPGAPVKIELDGQKVEEVPWPGETGRIWLTRRGDRWTVAARPEPALKGPHRNGPFKDAFRNRVLFVHGTRGTPAESDWAFAKARYDAETFWYRGNASVDVIPDTAFDATRERDRNVILYGNADSNAAWGPLLGNSPVQVRRGRIRVGDRDLAGDDLGCLLIRPRPGSDVATVGVVAGSGVAGMRLTDRLPYFVSGVAYPDCLVLEPETLARGSAGVRSAGFFGEDWGVASGEFGWGEQGQ